MGFSARQFILGTAQFGSSYGILNDTKGPGKDNAQEMLRLCFEKNIRTIDTAVNYEGYHDVTQKLNLDSISVVTKVALEKVNSDVKEVFLQQINSFRFQDLTILVHDPDKLNESQVKNLIEAVIDLRRIVNFKFGLSIYEEADLKHYWSFIECLDVIQAPFNLIDTRIKASGALAKLKSYGIELHSRSAFLQGLLIGEVANFPSRMKHVERYVKSLQECFNSRSELVSYCLFYAVQSGFDKTVIGASSIKELKQLLELIAKGPSIDEYKIPNFSKMPNEVIDPRLW